MILGTVLLGVGLLVAVLLVLTGAIVLDRESLIDFLRNYRSRLRAVGPSLLVLATVLLVTTLLRSISPEISWLVGWNVTGLIYAIEGPFVGIVQSVIPRFFTPYFSFVYVVGYVYLLLFPLFAYLLLEDGTHVRETTYAYTLNYGIGFLCYVAFIAYGPRNLVPDLVDPLLYSSWPQSRILTSQVNANTNVFPSLHTSLSVTVALLAYRTREIYPAWFPLATFVAANVVVSTMYLGIHWGTDVVAGGILAVVAVRLGTKMERTIGWDSSTLTSRLWGSVPLFPRSK